MTLSSLALVSAPAAAAAAAASAVSRPPRPLLPLPATRRPPLSSSAAPNAAAWTTRPSTRTRAWGDNSRQQYQQERRPPSMAGGGQWRRDDDGRRPPPPRAPPPPGDSARARAVEQLLRIEQSGAFAGLVSGGVPNEDADAYDFEEEDGGDSDDDDDDDGEDDDNGGHAGRGAGRAASSSFARGREDAALRRRRQRVVKDLVSGATRWQRRLDFVLSQLLTPPAPPRFDPRGRRTRPPTEQQGEEGRRDKKAPGGNVAALDPPMRAVLRLALFELTERRLPPHALGGYVDLARRMSGGGGRGGSAAAGGEPAPARGDRAAAFCNGVLRNAARQWERGDLPLPERALARELEAARQGEGRGGAGASGGSAAARREAVRALAALHSHPAWMVGRWLRAWGCAEAEAFLERNNARPAHSLRASRAGGAPDLLRALEREAAALRQEGEEEEDVWGPQEEKQEEEEEEEDDDDKRAGENAAAAAARAAAAALSATAAFAAGGAARAAAAPLPAAAALSNPKATAPAKAAAAPPFPKQGAPPPPPQMTTPPTTPPTPPLLPSASLSPLLPSDFVRLPAEGGLLQVALRSGLVASGLCTVQDEATGLVVRLALDPKPGETILDACAAPGGKALYASALLGGEGLVVATDASAPRLRALAGTARRLAGAGDGGRRATEALLVGPATDLRDYGRAREEWAQVQQQRQQQQQPQKPPLPERFDAVLLDAPCSGTGVLSKRADLRWRRTPEQLEALVALQDALLDAAAGLVKPGGRLVYATCSVERDENDDRVAAFLRRAAGRAFEVEAVLGQEEDGGGGGGDQEDREVWRLAGVVDGPFLRLLPHVHGSDGAFACRLRRRRD